MGENMGKFTVEDILREYPPDPPKKPPRRQKTRNDPPKVDRSIYARSTSHEKVLPPEKFTETPEEDLIDIQATISEIKWQKEARDREIPQTIREEFSSIQPPRRNHISYLDSGYRMTTPQENPDDFGDIPEDPVEISSKKRVKKEKTKKPKKEKKKKRQDFSDAPFNFEDEPEPPEQPEPAPESEKESPKKSRIRRKSRPTPVTIEPDNREKIHETLRNLSSVVFLRAGVLLLLLILSAILAFRESFFLSLLTPRWFALTQAILGAAAIATIFPTIWHGLRNFVLLRADSDSVVAIPIVVSTLLAILAIIFPDVLSDKMVHCYVPCGIFALFVEAIGRILVVRRALRNDTVLSKETAPHRALSDITQEDSAEQLTKGILHDYPIVAAARKTDRLCDFLKYTYSCDSSDAICRRIAPITAVVSILFAVFFTCVFEGGSFDITWFCALLSIFSLLMTACCLCASALTANLPLDWESKKVTATGSTFLGYQTADDFYDANALLVSAQDLFPKDSVQIHDLKIFPGAKLDDILIDAASIARCGGSILSDAFSHMIPEAGALRQIDNVSFEDHLGLCGWLAASRILFGNRELMKAHHVEGIPSEAREAELIPNAEHILYLSINGTISAMFSIQLNANASVKRRFRALKKENIALVIRVADEFVNAATINSLFDFPENQIRILPASMQKLFDIETEPRDCVSASATIGPDDFGAAGILISARKVHRASEWGMIVQNAFSMIGLLLALVHCFIGAYENMTATFFLIFYLIATAITVIVLKIRS